MASVVLASGAMLGMTAMVAHADSDGSSEEISPEEYPPPSEEETPTTPKPPVEQSLPDTGASASWPLLAVGGAVLIAVGGGLVLLRRRTQ